MIGEREAIFDFGELMKVQLESGRVQSCDTRWDEVHSALADQLGRNICESLFRSQLNNSEEMRYLTQVCHPETILKGEAYDYKWYEDTWSRNSRSRISKPETTWTTDHPRCISTWKNKRKSRT